MTLEEAIKHTEEEADSHDRMKQIKAVTLEECKRAEEHRQLAEWLKELKRLREQTRWIPINKTFPPKGIDILVTTNEGYVYAVFYDEKYKEFCLDDEGRSLEIKEVIAWMPLPKPYKAESEE